MRKLTFIVLILFCQTLSVRGQISLLTEGDGGGLYLDPDYIWRYNLYEHSRWGLGLAYDSDSLHSWRVVGNAGYGLYDKQLKWGVGASCLVDSTHRGSLYVMAMRGYSAAGNRIMQWGSITDPSGLASFMSLRMSDQRSAIAGYRWSSGYAAFVADVRLFYGGRLFDNNGLLYRKDGDTIAQENGLELRFGYSLGGFAVEALLGRTWPAQKPIAQLLAEYNITLHNSLFETHCYVQAGITPPNTPYIYMFDLGGTSGSFLYFRHSLLTVRPCEYVANAFALGSLRLGLENPLYSVWNNVVVMGSNPRPFIGLTGAWGIMWGQDESGCLNYEGLELQAPKNIVAEAVLGIDGLLRWGYVDYGIALAVSLLPDHSRTAILLTAGLNIN